MNFVKFIENRYQELSVESHASEKDSFDIDIDSEIKAAHQILNGYRWVVKWTKIPKIFLDYLLVLLHLKKEPEPVLLNKLKRDREKEDALKKANVTKLEPNQST